MKTLAERIQWILSDRELTHEQLALRSGFPSRAHISAILSRLRRNPAYAQAMGLKQYERIAQGGRVNLQWLMYGSGNPNDRTFVPQPTVRYPNLEKLLSHTSDGWSNSTVDAARNLEVGQDLTVEQWNKTLNAIEVVVEKITPKVLDQA